MELETKSTFEHLLEAVLPTAKFHAIIAFINANRNVIKPNDLKELADIELQQGNKSLDGILRIEKEEAKSGGTMYIVILEEDAFPPNIVIGPGVAFIEKQICFVQNGYSQAAHDMIRAHEIYHLEHAETSIGIKLNRIGIPLVGIFIHEIETIIASNLLKDPLGSAMAQLEFFLKMHKFVQKWITHFRRELHEIFDGTTFNTPL